MLTCAYCECGIIDTGANREPYVITEEQNRERTVRVFHNHGRSQCFRFWVEECKGWGWKPPQVIAWMNSEVAK